MSGPDSWRFNHKAYSRYVHDLELPEDQVLLEYVYINDDGQTLASKCRRVDKTPESPDDVPVWSFALNFPVEDCFLKPVAIYRDPFRRGPHRIVLCEVYANDWEPAFRNFRHACAETMSHPDVTSSEPWFGLEQEYSLVDSNQRPLGWPSPFMPRSEGPTHHDAVGMFTAYGRDLYEAHLFACMYAGINISGGNAEACEGQWEFQVGPSVGVKAADDLWMGRYLLHRLGEEFGIAVTFHPKPVGASGIYSNGGHVNFSTLPMREEGGLDVIKSVMPCLERCHHDYLHLCDPRGGADNESRLAGNMCTASKHFSWGVENRDATVRIPRQVAADGKGFLEDRRPASNYDPYLVTSALVKVVVLGEETVENPYIKPKVPKLSVSDPDNPFDS